jgi:hypothetical protein
MIAAVLPAVGEQILLAEKILAVVGGAVVGGLVVGLLAQLLTRAIAAQKLPRVPLLVTRLLGAVIGGWIVALWVLGGGGPGFGGLGGGWLGSGTGEGEKKAEVAKKDGESKKTNSDSKAPATETLRIEVLGKSSRSLKKPDAEASRYYRIDTGDGSRLLTFAEVKEVIKKRRQEQPPLRRIEIVLYNDSPSEQGPLVSQFKAWAGELDGEKVRLDVSKPDADAPMK